MRSGVWHQFGDRSQRLSLEQINEGVGDGVIISPRDLSPSLAERYAEKYHDRGVAVALDPQFHVVQHTVGRLEDWDLNDLRTGVHGSKRISDKEVDDLTRELVTVNGAIKASCVIAPGLIYEPGRPDILDANRRMFDAAKRAGDTLGVPTWGTIVVGRAGLAASTAFFSTLSDASSVAADGWYYATEFRGERIPSSEDEIYLSAKGLLTLAAGGRPVLHAFSGPVGLVGIAAGATAVTVGHAQNLWQFTRDRWAPTDGSGGGGDAPSRLFSRNLWGTIVYPDEVALLPGGVASQLVEDGPFASPLSASPPYPALPRWEAGKHLVWLMGGEYSRLLEIKGHRTRSEAVISKLETSITLLSEIDSAKLELKDGSGSYQEPWRNVLDRLKFEAEDDYTMLDLF